MPKRNTHLQGAQGQAFADLVRGVASERILCVAIDVSKDFHLVLIHNGLGEIVTPAFEIDIFQRGFDQLCQAIEEAVAESQAQVVLVGMEPTGHYHQNLADHLRALPWSVRLVNPYAVKENRHQHLRRRQKDDSIDCAALGDLLRRGHGKPYQPAEGVYLELQVLDRHRLSEVRMQTMLKNRIIGHLDRLFPGLILTKAGRQRYQPLFASDFWRCQTVQHLIRVCPDPHELAQMCPAQLIEAFHAQGYAMGPVMSQRILAYARQVLPPDPARVAIRRPLLAQDLGALEQITARIEQMNEQLAALLVQTPYQILTQVKGLTTVSVASLAAAMGDPSRYQRAAQIFSKSGLVPGRHDSGSRQRQGQDQAITRSGDRYLRRALMNATRALIWHQPCLRRYFRRLSQRKHEGVARVACARRLTGLLWATIRDQQARRLILKEQPM